VGYFTFVGSIWGFLEAYTYFRGNSLKKALGPYWVLIYSLPLLVAFVIALVSLKSGFEKHRGEVSQTILVERESTTGDVKQRLRKPGKQKVTVRDSQTGNIEQEQ